MTNIAQHAFSERNKVTVLSDGSKLLSSDFDNKCKFDIYRFDQIKFLRKRIKFSFAQNFLKQNKIDIIFFDSWKSLELFDYSTDTKKICLVHGNEILKLSDKNRIINSLNKADLLIFNSQFTKNKTIKNFKTSKKINHKVIYPAFIKKISKNKVNKKKYDLCTVARLEYRKGHHLVFEAMSILRDDYKISLKYAILGDGPELSRLKDLVMKFSLQKQVDFIHHDISSEKIYKNSSVHIMPTISTPESIEGFGISNVEAASFGLPCVISNSGGTPESIGDNGIIVKENDPKKLVKSIIDIFKTYQSYSRKSYVFAKNFESKKKIEEYLDNF
jgi:glycosyltransferase involved in cell wall biosynthesis